MPNTKVFWDALCANQEMLEECGFVSAIKFKPAEFNTLYQATIEAFEIYGVMREDLMREAIALCDSNAPFICIEVANTEFGVSQYKVDRGISAGSKKRRKR